MQRTKSVWNLRSTSESVLDRKRCRFLSDWERDSGGDLRRQGRVTSTPHRGPESTGQPKYGHVPPRALGHRHKPVLCGCPQFLVGQPTGVGPGPYHPLTPARSEARTKLLTPDVRVPDPTKVGTTRRDLLRYLIPELRPPEIFTKTQSFGVDCPETQREEKDTTGMTKPRSGPGRGRGSHGSWLVAPRTTCERRPTSPATFQKPLKVHAAGGGLPTDP